MELEKSNEIIDKVARGCIYQETCIDVDVFTNTPLLKLYYYTSSSTFVVGMSANCRETIKIENSTFALVIDLEDGEITVSLEDGYGEYLGEIEEVR